MYILQENSSLFSVRSIVIYELHVTLKTKFRFFTKLRKSALCDSLYFLKMQRLNTTMYFVF